MSIFNIIIITVLILTVLYIVKDISISQIGGKAIPISLQSEGPHYIRQYREHENVDNVLNRPLYPANKDTNALQSANTWTNLDGSNNVNYELIKPVKRYLEFTDIDKALVSPETRALVESKQPYFLDEANIIDCYGKKYYVDWRYPKQPLPIEFAQDSEKYIKEHPSLYPSYIIRSRDSSLLTELS
uniref:Uncharacterized protein n=1 Tax=viral metagenome TaxID=1070528 RepID=A0A6C0J9A4_9ZZZZ